MNTNNTGYSEAVLQRLAERKEEGLVEAKARLAAIENKMTPEWTVAMGAKVDSLTREASSPRSKLPKLFALMEVVGEVRAPHLACGPGCSACCRLIPVQISDLEAKHIATVTGREPAALSPGVHAPIRVNTSCPFLVDNRCSIYEHRPYNCRSLAVVDRDALTCGDENTALTRAKDPRAIPVAMTRMQAFDPLYKKLTSRTGAVWADIRQFFPTPGQPAA